MKRMMAIVVGLAVMLTCGFVANAAPSKKLRQRIEVMLNAPEYTPSEREWKALGPDAAVVLREVALNKKALVLKRGRAATALGYFKTAPSRTALTGLVGNKKGSWLLRGKAAHALALAYGADSLASIKLLLDDKHKRAREVGIKAIATVPVKKSRQLLQNRLPKEKNSHLRKLIKREVAKIEKIEKKKGAK